MVALSADRDVARARALVALHEVLGLTGTDSASVLQTAAGETARLLAAGCGLWVREGSTVSLRAFSHEDPAAADLIEQLLVGRQHGMSTSIGPVVMSGQEVRVDGTTLPALLPGLDPAYRAYFEARACSDLVVLPLVARGEHLGAIAVTRDGHEPGFEDDDLVFLRQVARVVSLAVVNTLLLEEVGEARRQALLLAHEDDLTGLLNRRGFLDRLARAPRTAATARLVALLDMDGFRLVNDGFGHATGDVVLTSLAARLCSAVPPTTTVARLGGDEFALLVEAPDEELAAQLVEEAVRALTGTIQVVGLSVPLSVSVGTAVPGPDAGITLQHAELALHRAKRKGLVVAAYDQALDDPATRRLKQVLDLRQEIADERLVVHYQPVVSVTDGPPRVEALVRRVVDGQLVPPAGWLQLVERAGLMPELTDSVVGQVVNQLSRWWADGLPVEVAVNIPAACLTPELVGRLLDRLDVADLPRRALSVEVTEGDLVGPSARAALARCAEAELSVAVDDFGTGYSALSYLVDLPLRVLKIDRSFVDGIDLDTRRAAVVRAVVDIAHELGLRVVAEGVETAAVADAVIDLGADALQGWYYGRPAAAEGLEELLRAGAVAARS